MAILVTGGSSGIGRAIAERLARPDTDVFINFHSNEAGALEAASAIRTKGARPHLVRADVSSLEEIRGLAAAIAAETDRLDTIVHAAAVAISGRVVDIDGNQLDAAVAANGTSIVHVVRENLALLKSGSSVIYVTSKGAQRALKNYAAIGGPKALGEHLVRYLATELADQGIRVNSISPGPLDTEARRRMFPDTWQQRLENQTEANPSGRGLEFDDVANLVELMIDARFTMVQGETITIDGGLTL